jgi:hypothetical protein
MCDFLTEFTESNPSASQGILNSRQQIHHKGFLTRGGALILQNKLQSPLIFKSEVSNNSSILARKDDKLF